MRRSPKKMSFPFIRSVSDYHSKSTLCRGLYSNTRTKQATIVLQLTRKLTHLNLSLKGNLEQNDKPATFSTVVVANAKNSTTNERNTSFKTFYSSSRCFCNVTAKVTLGNQWNEEFRNSVSYSLAAESRRVETIRVRVLMAKVRLAEKLNRTDVAPK